MIISSLKVKNYKSIEDMKLEFVKGKNIIVGQNNSGKSNIISAINLVIGEKYPAKRFDDNYYYQNTDKFIIILKLTDCDNFDYSYLENYNKSIGIYDLPFESDSLLKNSDEFDELGIRPTWKNGKEVIELIKNSSAVYVSLVSLKEEDTIYTLSLGYNNAVKRFKFFTQDLLTSFITSAIIPSERSIKSELVVNGYSWYGKLIRNTWNNMSNENIEQLKKNNLKLSDVTNNIFDNLTNELSDSVKDAISYNKLEFKLIQDTKNDCYKGIKILLDDGYYSMLEDKGSGIKSLIIIELFKLYCKKYHKFSSCLIVEEPEVFLHPQARSVLSKKIDQFIVGNNNQTIITTHSEQFLSNFDIQQLTFISNSNKGSKKYKVLENDFSEKELQKMNIITKTENSEMYFADVVILVEGGEKYIIKKLFELYENELFLDYNNVSVIKVGGKSYFSIYKKMLEKLGKKVYILGDYDNLKNEINDFLDLKNLNLLNKIKGRTKGLKKYDLLLDNDKNDLDKIFNHLKEKNIFILHNGELEDYYNLNMVKQISLDNNISGKEIVAHFISTLINKENIENILNVNNDFSEYIGIVIKDLKRK